MLADTPDVDDPTRAVQFLPEDLPIRRIGLEHEFFLVDQRGELSDLADLFLWQCQEAARAKGLDPHCFKPECVTNLVEVTTPPGSSFADMARGYLSNLDLALEIASELGFSLYPLGTYPLPVWPVGRDDPGFRIKDHIIGHDRFLQAGRCAGAHLHLEVPVGTVWPDVKAALRAPFDAQRELLDLYNLATALDPALVALSRACPFYKGEVDGFAARTVHYRGILGFEGVYTGLGRVGGLSSYASRVEDLVDQQRARYREWFAAMDRAGVDRRLFAQAGGNLHRASWNPVRLSHHGTVEIRSMDANYPEMVLALCALILGAAERIRRERLEVRPGRGVLTLEPDGGLLHVPTFSYLSGELLRAAVTGGVQDPRVEAYVDSVVRFASPYLEAPQLVGPLVSSEGYETTEHEILASFPTRNASVSREEGLSLVRRSCRRLDERVSSLRRRLDATLPGGGLEERAANVVSIRDSPTVPAARQP